MVAFDPSHAVQFDFGKGQVKLDGSVPRVLVPPSALAELVRGSPDDRVRQFGQQVGAEAGQRLAKRVGGGLKDASVEILVEQLGGELALMGLGALGVERWGRALVITVDDPPWAKEGDPLLAAILQGALESAFDRKNAVLPVSRVGSQARFLVVADRARAQVELWVKAGESLGTIVDKLHAASQSSG